MADQLLEVGYVSKAHGVRGDLIIMATSNLPHRFDVGVKLWLSPDATAQIDIAQCQPYQRGYLVHLLGVDTRESAEALRGKTLYGYSAGAEGDLMIHELIGSVVVTIDGVNRGTVSSVQDNPASDLLVLDNGALVPLVFVKHHDLQAQQITVEVPEGLFELYLGDDTA